MEQIKISVIVTVHNAEKYLEECIDSVLEQTFSDIEILCIDGGSVDSSSAILSRYAKKDDRIRIINDSNTSYGHKINRGIAEARGEYISVLESDDMYEPYMLEKLYEVAEEYHTDFVNADFTCFFDINGKRCKYVTKMYPNKDYNRLMENKKHPEEFGVIPRFWTGIFRKEYLEREHIRMNESPGASFQDMSFRFLTSVLADSSYHLDLPVYLYRTDNPGSSMHDSTKTVVIADEHEFLKRELLKRNITDRYIWHNAYQWKYIDFRGNMINLRGKYRQELFDRYLTELERDRNALNEYMDLGYDSVALEMIKEEPDRVMRLIEDDALRQQDTDKNLYHILDRVTRFQEDRRLVIFGCGLRGNFILECLQFAAGQIACLTDNSQALWNKKKGNYDILPPEQAVLQNPDACFIVANKLHADEIENQLRSMRIPKEMIYIY